jgi:spore germination protein GerM
VELFFPGSAGGMQRETREIVGSDFLETDVRRTVEELITGPEEGSHPLPPSTRVLSVFYDREGEITVNFSEDLTVDHPGGSDAEIETIRCLVTTIGKNFPGVDRVRVLVEGDVVSTLAGHMDLSRPLSLADFD